MSFFKMPQALYNFFTLWLTLMLIFFLVEYTTKWLEVVTLGGLVGGTVLQTFVVCLGVKLAAKVVKKDFWFTPIAAVERMEIIKAIITVAAFAWEGTLIISRILPGYTFHQGIDHVIFLLIVYPLLALTIERVIKQRSAK